MTGKALITGASGQDAYYLARLLGSKDYEVHLQSRAARPAYPLGAGMFWHAASLSAGRELEDLIAAIRPTEIYNLAGVSRPQQSWDIPDETMRINLGVPLRILEAVRTALPECRVYQATSSEIFGNPPTATQDEATPLCPENPYAIAKASAHRLIGAYRSRYGLFLSSGILFNHESPRRGLAYVTQKVATAAALLSLGRRDAADADEAGRPLLVDGRLSLGDLGVRRDFGFAGDYVEAMWRMLQAEGADDYVIGTGQAHAISDICEAAFSHVQLDWRDHVTTDPRLLRPIDTRHTCADSSKAETKLGWQPAVGFDALIRMMVDARLKELRAPPPARSRASS